MSSITEAKANLVNLAERLRAISEALKCLPSDHPSFYEKMEEFREEIKFIAAQLRGD